MRVLNGRNAYKRTVLKDVPEERKAIFQFYFLENYSLCHSDLAKDTKELLFPMLLNPGRSSGGPDLAWHKDRPGSGS